MLLQCGGSSGKGFHGICSYRGEPTSFEVELDLAIHVWWCYKRFYSASCQVESGCDHVNNGFKVPIKTWFVPDCK